MEKIKNLDFRPPISLDPFRQYIWNKFSYNLLGEGFKKIYNKLKPNGYRKQKESPCERVVGQKDLDEVEKWILERMSGV